MDLPGICCVFALGPLKGTFSKKFKLLVSLFADLRRKTVRGIEWFPMLSVEGEVELILRIISLFWEKEMAACYFSKKSPPSKWTGTEWTSTKECLS